MLKLMKHKMVVFDEVYISFHFNIICGYHYRGQRIINCDFYFQDKLKVYHVKVEMLSMFAVQILGGSVFNNPKTTCLP